MPKEESFPIPLKFFDVTRTTQTSLDVVLDKILMVTGTWTEIELSDAWIGFTRFTSLHERPPDGYTWSGERLTMKQTTSRPDNVWPDLWKHLSDASERKAKQKCAIEKPKLDNVRKLRGIFSIEREDEDFKNIMKKRQKELEIPMPYKTQINSGGETYGGIEKSKTKHACIVEADESTRIRLEGVPERYHEDHIAAKGINSPNHYNSVHKIIPMPQAEKKTGCEGCSGERMGKVEEKSGMATDESQKQKRGDR